MTEFGENVDDETKDDLEQAAIENEREKTRYGGDLPDDHREE